MCRRVGAGAPTVQPLRRLGALGVSVAGALLVGAALASPAAAQAVLAGQVTVAGSGAPLAGAEVRLPALDRATHTDSGGRFALGELPPGAHEVVVRLAGYEPSRRAVTLAAGDTTRAEFALARPPQPLAGVQVTGTGPTPPRMVEFERRRRAGFGAFLTREQLEKRESAKLSDVLRGTPGIRFIYLSKGKGIALANNRYGGKQPGSHGPNQCYMQVFLNGVRIYDPSQSQLPGITVDPPNINEFEPGVIEGIEIYAGPGQTPPEFGGTNAMCGTVVIWTRVG
ncbi:MAG TPA: TonB-dependent receptor [Gemmatimonadaceae bacterium]|nr:TonB-dependent receptor [Gemmatimonadaceae bacterium]